MQYHVPHAWTVCLFMCMSLRVYVPYVRMSLFCAFPFMCMSSSVCFSVCIFHPYACLLNVHAPSCACLPCVCPSVSMFLLCDISFVCMFPISLRVYVTPCICHSECISFHGYFSSCVCPSVPLISSYVCPSMSPAGACSFMWMFPHVYVFHVYVPTCRSVYVSSWLLATFHHIHPPYPYTMMIKPTTFGKTREAASLLRSNTYVNSREPILHKVREYKPVSSMVDP